MSEPKNELTDAQRTEYGTAWFHHIMHRPAPPPEGAYIATGILPFVFAEMWSRPQLDRRARRFITVACVASAGTAVPVQTHVYAALKSGDITFEEMQEFILHFAVYLGWPKASYLQQVVYEQWALVQQEGGTETIPVPQRPEGLR